MPKFSIFIPALLLGGGIFTGCFFQEKENTGKPVPTKFEVKALATLGAAAKVAADSSTFITITDSSGLHFTIQSARAKVGKIKLEGGSVKCPTVQDTALAGREGSESDKECGD